MRVPSDTCPADDLIALYGGDWERTALVNLRRFEWPERAARDLLSCLVADTGGSLAGRWLDLGCGWGSWGHVLSLDGRCKVVGVDADERMVAAARRIARGIGAPVEGWHGDVWDDAVVMGSRPWDGVTCSMFLRHVGEPRRFLRRMVDLVKPGGMVLVVERDERQVERSLGIAADAEPVGEAGGGCRDELVSNLADWFAESGLVGVQSWDSPVVWDLAPPYSEEQRQLAVALAAWVEGGGGIGEGEDRMAERIEIGQQLRAATPTLELATGITAVWGRRVR